MKRGVRRAVETLVELGLDDRHLTHPVNDEILQIRGQALEPSVAHPIEPEQERVFVKYGVREVVIELVGDDVEGRVLGPFDDPGAERGIELSPRHGGGVAAEKLHELLLERRADRAHLDPGHVGGGPHFGPGRVEAPPTAGVARGDEPHGSGLRQNRVAHLLEERTDHHLLGETVVRDRVRDVRHLEFGEEARHPADGRVGQLEGSELHLLDHLAEVAELGGRKDVDLDPALGPPFEVVLEEDAGDVVVGIVADRADVTVLENEVLGMRGSGHRAEDGRGGEPTALFQNRVHGFSPVVEGNCAIEGSFALEGSSRANEANRLAGTILA